MTIAPVLRVLDALGVRYALIGGHAMAVRGYPRFTADLDLLTTDRRVLDLTVWRELLSAGAAIDPRHGDPDDPLAGVVHIMLPDDSDIDIVVGRWTWEARIVERAEPLSLMGAVLPVPTAADLILLKLAAGGYVDKQDAAASWRPATATRSFVTSRRPSPRCAPTSAHFGKNCWPRSLLPDRASPPCPEPRSNCRPQSGPTPANITARALPSPRRCS
jgi:hypothetical protein